MKVGVKFCGNCNPHVDMPGLLKNLAAAAEGVTFVRWDDDGYDILLVLSGCPVDCASRPDFGGRVIVATSEAVDRWPTAACDLPAAILAALTKGGERCD